MIKLLIGGSPCTSWSIAKTTGREIKPEGVGWELFKNFLIAKEKFQPDFFLYENNKSAAQSIKDQIAEELGVGTDPLARFTYINSALVSAQKRERFYVTNFGDIQQPVDKGIFLKNILESGTTQREKACTLRASAGTKQGQSNFIKHIETKGQFGYMGVFDYPAEPVGMTNQGKSYCLTVNYDGAVLWNTLERKQRAMVAEPVILNDSKGKAGTIRATCYKDGIRNLVGNNIDKRTCVAYPIRIGNMPNSDGKISNSQGSRIYKIDEKSVTLKANGGGWGAKTGLYAIPANQSAYPVHNGKITIKDKEYDIKLPDGYYIIRKLTVTECCRLQGLPDWWFLDSEGNKILSDTRAYQGLGNGWQADTIEHILSHMPIDKNEELLVLSMYDGIATGRYVLEKMGFKNVKYIAYENDKYCIKLTSYRYPDIIHMGDAFQIRDEDWSINA